jgi:hypothetical protein
VITTRSVGIITRRGNTERKGKNESVRYYYEHLFPTMLFLHDI